VRLHEKGGKRHDVPAHHTVDAYLEAYVQGAVLETDPKGPLFRTVHGKTDALTARPMRQVDVYRDRIYSALFQQRVRHMGIEEIVIAPRSPWQNPYVERLIGSIRRECLDHVIVLHERHLRRLLTGYFQYYHHWRMHRALDMDCPLPRPVQRPEVGSIRKVPEVGGLHHHYERRAA
jgi:Integrase core domain